MSSSTTSPTATSLRPFAATHAVPDDDEVVERVDDVEERDRRPLPDVKVIAAPAQVDRGQAVEAYRGGCVGPFLDEHRQRQPEPGLDDLGPADEPADRDVLLDAALRQRRSVVGTEIAGNASRSRRSSSGSARRMPSTSIDQTPPWYCAAMRSTSNQMRGEYPSRVISASASRSLALRPSNMSPLPPGSSASTTRDSLSPTTRMT